MGIYALIVLLTSCSMLQGFDTLTQAQQHAENILLKRGGKSFDPSRLKTLLSSLVTTRENTGYSGNYIIKLTPYPATKFVLWGPLKGAFKSLVRDLTYLEKIGIMGNDFKIRDPHVYFVFNGDVIDGSSDVLEIFTLVLSLMRANPHRVFYMRGLTEDHWQDDGLRDALQARARVFRPRQFLLEVWLLAFLIPFLLVSLLLVRIPLRGLSVFPRILESIRCLMKGPVVRRCRAD